MKEISLKGFYENPEQRELLRLIENEILKVANSYNKLTTSDLQGYTTTQAIKIINTIKKAEMRK